MVDRTEAELQVSDAEYLAEAATEDTRALLTLQSLDLSDGDTGEQGTSTRLCTDYFYYIRLLYCC